MRNRAGGLLIKNGKILLNKIEEYFRENGINFYDKNGYHSRMIIDIKKL